MDTENPSAPSCAESRNAGKNHTRVGGLTHENARHTTRFTVIGNHLAQHRELSLLAIGLGVHIQSLPKGARVDIKALTARFPEGSTRIAAGLRELEAHGYLRRERSRIRGGRMVTRTISCNQPGLRRNLVAVDLSPYKSYIFEEFRDEGRAQRGAEDILLVLNARGLDVSDEVRERVTGCDDPDLLRHWLTRAVTASSAEAIFVEKE
ncbi:hypothetical protein [Streptomyces sp. NPDC020597]|uniref:hypothetical protein n=1 Tax=unclassified Streptomyces TaxID=2593676 RepID=UPI0037B891FA